MEVATAESDPDLCANLKDWVHKLREESTLKLKMHDGQLPAFFEEAVVDRAENEADFAKMLTTVRGIFFTNPSL